MRTVSKLTRGLIGLVALLACTGANAAVFVAHLFTTEENALNTPFPPGGPPVPLTAGPGALDPTALRPTSFGTAVFVLNAAQTAMTMQATVFNIDITGSQTPGANDNLVAAHIHASAAINPLTRGVVWGFFGLPDSDINPKNLVIEPFTTGVGGIFTSTWDLNEGNNTTLTAQIPNISAERSYINFHTVQFSSGEIRGTLVVPEPGSLALLGLSLCGIYLIQRRRKTA